MARPNRPALTRDAVLDAAVGLADRDGLAALSMRWLARHLGIEAMSLYHHVANEDALLDGMVDVVFGEIHLPRVGADWAGELQLRHTSAREVLTRHRWAVGLVDSRSAPELMTLRHHDAVLGCLRQGRRLLGAVGRARVRAPRRAPLRLPGPGAGAAVRPGRRPRGDDHGDDGPTSRSTLSPTWPSLATRARHPPRLCVRRRVRLGLELVLDGLEQRRSIRTASKQRR